MHSFIGYVPQKSFQKSLLLPLFVSILILSLFVHLIVITDSIFFDFTAGQLYDLEGMSKHIRVE